MLDSKRKIQDALISLIDKKQLREIQIQEIVKLSGVSRSTFYRHYDTVEDIINEIKDNFIQDIREINRGSILVNHTRDIEDNRFSIENMRYIKNHSRVFLALTGPYGPPSFSEELHAQLAEYYAGGIVFHNLQTEHINIRVKFVSAGGLSVLRYWLTECPDIPPEQMSAILNKLAYTFS